MKRAERAHGLLVDERSTEHARRDILRTVAIRKRGRCAARCKEQPSAAKVAAAARPMPRDAPVINTDFPASSRSKLASLGNRPASDIDGMHFPFSICCQQRRHLRQLLPGFLTQLRRMPQSFRIASHPATPDGNLCGSSSALQLLRAARAAFSKD
jgi:hypothetical protein